MRGPVNPVVMPRLQPWNEMPNDSVKYYSGTAVYTTGFDLVKLPANERILLDLGKLSAMSKVYVNGQYAGGVWTTPYELDITQWVKEGRNDLRVEVVNTWVNRLIGDSRLACFAAPYLDCGQPVASRFAAANFRFARAGAGDSRGVRAIKLNGTDRLQ